MCFSLVQKLWTFFLQNIIKTKISITKISQFKKKKKIIHSQVTAQVSVFLTQEKKGHAAFLSYWVRRTFQNKGRDKQPSSSLGLHSSLSARTTNTLVQHATPEWYDLASFFCGYDPGEGKTSSSTLHGQQGAAFASILELMYKSVLGRYVSYDLLFCLLKLHICHNLLRTVVLLTRSEDWKKKTGFCGNYRFFFPPMTDSRLFKRQATSAGAINIREVEKGKAAKMKKSPLYRLSPCGAQLQACASSGTSSARLQRSAA